MKYIGYNVEIYKIIIAGILCTFCFGNAHADQVDGASKEQKFKGQLHYTIRNAILWRSPDGPVQAIQDQAAGMPTEQIKARWVSCIMPEGSEFTSDFGDPNYMMWRGGENQGVCAGKYGWISFDDAP